MKIFVDTANIEEIKKAAAWGVLDGVTTNPSLAAKEGRDLKESLREICEIVAGPVNAEVVSTEADKIVEEAKDIASWHPNISVKIPMIPEGIKATKALSQEGIFANVTLCFSANQAVLAAKAGAAYCSIFVGRLDDAGHDGLEVVREAMHIYENYGFSTKIIAASIRHPRHVVEAGLAGAHVVTMPFKVLSQMFKHPLTDTGLKGFLADWEKLQKLAE